MAIHEFSTMNDPEAAVTLAILFQQLGGRFSIASNGDRYFGSPEPEAADGSDRERVIRMLEKLLRRLSASDRNLIFDLYATVTVDDRKLITSIEEPRRPLQC